MRALYALLIAALPALYNSAPFRLYLEAGNAAGLTLRLRPGLDDASVSRANGYNAGGSAGDGDVVLSVDTGVSVEQPSGAAFGDVALASSRSSAVFDNVPLLVMGVLLLLLLSLSMARRAKRRKTLPAALADHMLAAANKAFVEVQRISRLKKDWKPFRRKKRNETPKEYRARKTQMQDDRSAKRTRCLNDAWHKAISVCCKAMSDEARKHAHKSAARKMWDEAIMKV